MLQPRFPKLNLASQCLIVLLSFCCSAPVLAGTNKMQIVTDIAPVHSLVSMVIGEHADITLLVPPSQSPHSFSLKPSQIRAMNHASLIVILSDDFTPTLSRHIKSLENKKPLLLKLSDSTDIQTGDDQDAGKRRHTHAENSNNASNTSANSHAAHVNDAHTWLNAENAIDWIDRIADIAIQLDKKNQSSYLLNAKIAKADLKALHTSLKNQLTSVQSSHYIVYHDAYQHFAQGYNLQKPVAIALSDARAPGAKKLKEIREKVKHSTCVFSEIQHGDTIVDTVTEGLPVKRGVLDPIGSTIPIGPTHYLQLMRALANSFSTCLS